MGWRVSWVPVRIGPIGLKKMTRWPLRTRNWLRSPAPSGAGDPFGFIAPGDGSADVFAHYSAIASSGYRSLEENQKVQFEVAQGPKGPQAENIRPL